MEARSTRPTMGLASVLLFALSSGASAQLMMPREHVAQSQNFIIFASSPQWAAKIAQVAEQNRRELAIYWLGKELPPWSQRCPIHVTSHPQLGAGGETRFSLMQGGVGNWMMSVQGTQERILDSVLPHEITHTIFATHFAPLGKYVPRWADEGACTTVEHSSEKRKHQHFLNRFLRSGRGLSFNTMFSLKEYPEDILPLYAQGHSAVQFLIDQGGPRKFIQFIETGMRTERWEQTLRERYGYETIGQFQTLWNQWLADGSPDDLLAYAPGLRREAAGAEVVLASNTASDQGVQWAGGSGQPATTALAGNLNQQSNATLAGDPVALSTSIPASQEPSGSWYKRRLREVRGDGTADRQTPKSQASANNYPLHPYQPAPKSGHLAPQSTARPLPMQSPGVQVLDWGNRPVVPGIQQPPMVPIYR